VLPADDDRGAEDRLVELDERVLGARVVAPRDEPLVVDGRRTDVGERVTGPLEPVRRLGRDDEV